MARVLRFRRLKHGVPPRFKVLPKDLARSCGGGWFGAAPGMLGVTALIATSIGVLALLGRILC